MKINDSNDNDNVLILQMEVEEARQKEKEANMQFLAASTTPQHHHVAEHDDENDDLPNGDVTKELETDSNIVDPVEERRTLAERNERLHDQLKVREFSNKYDA